MTLRASIDIGTNSTRMLIVENGNGIAHFERLTKLGAGLDENGVLSVSAMDRVISTLQEYKTLGAGYDVQSYHLMATSATRDAKNRQDFLNRITTETGLHCRVLSGEEEAQLSFLGVLTDFEPPGAFLMCDVGGGSTEFIIGEGRKILDRASLDIGSGRMMRQFVNNDPPQEIEIKALQDLVRQAIQQRFPQTIIKDAVCLGGTASTLGAVDSKLPWEQTAAVHHHRLSRQRLDELANDLAHQTVEQRKTLTGLHPQRADVILAGTLIITSIMQCFGTESIMISHRDLLYGVFQEET